MIDFHIIIPIAKAAEEAVQEAASPVGVLGLDLKLFIGQLINFGILLFVFWKWILPNIVKGLAARQERISKSLTDADRIEKEKQEFEVWKNAEMGKARQEASTIITKSQTEAGKVKDEILAQAKTEQQKLVEQAKKQIESEKQQALMSAKGELADLVTMATEKVLRQKLDTKKDGELVKESLKNI